MAVTTAALAPPRRARGIVGTAWLWWAVGPIAAVLVWAAAAAVVGSIAILPGPIAVATNFVVNFAGSPSLAYLGLEVSSYAENLLYTGRIVLIGVAAGALVGIVVGTASARVQGLRNISEPVSTVFGVVPILVAVPFFLVWFGQGPFGKFLLVTFFTAVIVSVVAQSSALTLPPRYEEYAATLGAGRARRLTSIVIPATLAANLTGVRAALGQAWGLQAVAELLGSPAGIGRAVAVRAGTGDVTSVIALILALGLVALIFDALLSIAIRWLTRWKTQET